MIFQRKEEGVVNENGKPLLRQPVELAAAVDVIANKGKGSEDAVVALGVRLLAQRAPRETLNERLTHKALVKLCRERGLKPQGTKTDMIVLLMAHVSFVCRCNGRAFLNCGFFQRNNTKKLKKQD